MLTAGLFMSPLISADILEKTKTFGHTGRIAPTAFLDDCFRITLASDEIGISVKEALKSNIHQHLPGNTARLGRTFPVAIQHGASLIVLVKKKLSKYEDQNIANEMLAVGLGVLTKIGYEKSLEPIQDTTDAGVYLDAAILKDMNDMDPSEEINGNHDELADLLRSLSTRFLTRVHTVIPDDEDPENWILRLDQWRRDLDRYYTNVAKVYLHPDSEKYNRLVRQQNLYHPSDALIKLARDVQRSATRQGSIVSGIIKNANRSAYARAMETSYRRILAADKFLNDTIDEVEFRKRISS